MRATFQIISRDDRLAMPVLFVIAWLMRVAVVFLHPQPDHFISTDTLHYWEGARSIVASGLPADNTFPVGLSYFMTPFVALGLSLWSYGHFIQPALGAALVALSYLLASRLGGRLAGWLAGTICLLHPALINSSSQILTEDLSAVLILSGIVLLLKKEHLPAGIVFGSANIVRSPSLGMFCLLLIVLVRTGYDWKHSFRPLLGGWAAVIILTSIHLSMAYGRFVFLTPQVWELGVTRPLAQGGVFYMLSAEAREHYGSYLGFAIHHPFEFLADRLAAFHAFINTWPGGHRTTLTKAVMTLSEAPFMLGALWLLVTRRAPGSVNDHRHHHLKLLPAAWLGLCVFHTLTYGDARYRVIGLPLLVVFITIALADFVRNRIPAGVWKLVFIPPEPDLPCAICQGRPVLVEGGSVMPCICASAPRN